ncbi:Glutathione transport system permease protein GsiC [subsurface metagenome]
MRAYVLRRLLLIIPTVFLVTLGVFFLTHLIPGDIIDAMQAQATDVELPRAELERAMGLDAPLLTQYGRWMGFVPLRDGNFSGILQGNFGSSIWQKVSVLELAAQRWPVTFELTLMALITGLLISLPVGIYSALRQDTWGDYIGRSFAIACIAVPYFWLGTMIIVFPAVWWGYMPPIRLTLFFEDPIGNLRMFMPPAVVMGMALSGMSMRMTRTMMLEVLRQDYIRTAWAKGLRERVVVIRHALKNALIPVISIIGIQMPLLVGGSVIVEKIFMLPGMGRLIIDAVYLRDYTVVSGILLLFSVALVLINLMVDLSYAFLDPRIHYK